MLALILVGTGFSAILLWLLLSPANQKPTPTSGSAPDSSGDSTPRLTTDDALVIANRILSASQASDLRGLIRPGDLDASAVLAGMEALVERHGLTGEPRWLGTIDTLALPVEGVVVRYDDGHPRLMEFTPGPDSGWLVDMDSFLGHCDPAFSELGKGDQQQALVRVIAMADTYYNGPFSDDEEWACFSLRVDPKDEPIYAYCRRGAAAMEALIKIEGKAQALISNPGQSASAFKGLRARVTLRLQRRPDTPVRQYEISEVLSDTWVIPEVPLQEALQQSADG